MRPLDAALAYAERLNWPVFPRPNGRYLKGSHGWKDATTNPEKIREWWTEYPGALIGMPTGAASHIVVLDIDVKNGKNGFDSLDAIGKAALPETPIAHTPHDGIHLYFRSTLHVPTGTDVLGPGLDVLGDGGNVALPTPGTLYRWDETHRPSTTPFHLAPYWLAPGSRNSSQRAYAAANLRPEIILERACQLIRDAGPGQRNEVLNRQAFLIGSMVRAGALDQTIAEHELSAAAATMVKLTKGNPNKAEYDLNRSFDHGRHKGRFK